MANHLCIICRESFEGKVNAKVCQKDSCQKQHVNNYMRSYRRGIKLSEQRMFRISGPEREHLNLLKSDCHLVEPKTFQALPIQKFVEIVNRFLRMHAEDK